MAPRAVWKGYLKVADLSCAVSLYTAVSASERIAFHTLNRATGHRVHRQFVDAETGTPVSREDQVKGYEVSRDEYVVFEPEEIAAAVPESDRALDVKAMVPCHEIDTLYLDRPYYLSPSDKVAEAAYRLICDSLEAGKVAALAQAVLFRRVRTVLVRAHDGGLVATLLNFDYEVRSAKDAFEDIPQLSIKAEMADLAGHIIKTKLGQFDPKSFDDRYENAVAEMVRAKMEGRALVRKPAPAATKVIDLMDALRASAKAVASSGKKAGAATKKPNAVARKPKAAAKAAIEPKRKAG